jgi:MFS family permease
VKAEPQSPLPGATLAVAMLCLLYAFSGIDRLILSLLVVPIQAELQVSDTGIGVLFGLSFAVLYSLAGLPIARIADHGNRVRLVTIGVVFWSASTLLSGFAPNYWTLVACRAGVAVGEAVLTPAAISMIASLYPRDQRARPTAIFVTTGAVFGLGAAAVGGVVLALATKMSPHLGDIAPWRLTLILVGFPGIIAGLAFAMLVPEPPREAQTTASATHAARQHLMDNWGFYIAIFTAVGASVMVSYALIGWVPSLLVRRFEIAPASAGYLFGIIGIAAGAAGMMGLPPLAAWLTRRTGRDGLIPIGVAMALVALPAVLIAMNAQTLSLFAVALAVSLACLPAISLLPSLMVQQVTPANLRGQTMAVYLLIGNLMGLGGGPVLAGWLSDNVYKQSGGMGDALAALAIGALLATAVLLLLAVRPYRRLLAKAAAGD